MKKFVCLLAAIVMLSGCGIKPMSTEKITTYEQLDGKKLAMVTSAISNYYLLEKSTGIKMDVQYFNSTEDVVYSVIAGKTDGAIMDSVSAEVYIHTIGDKVTALPVFCDVEWSYITNLNNTELLDELNPILRRMRESGTIEQLEQKWTQEDLTGVTFEPVTFTGEKGTLKVAVGGNFPGYCFVKDNELVGCDIDIMRIVGAQAGYVLDFISVSEDAFIPMVQSGKVDLCAIDLAATEEKKEQVAFFEPIYVNGLTVLVRK